MATSASTPTLTTATFDEHLAADATTVLVDFWAPWCGPCKTYTPTLESFVEQHPTLRLVTVNTDDEPDLARRFDVMSVPTLIVFEDGQPVKRLVGARGNGRLLEDLADHLG